MNNEMEICTVNTKTAGLVIQFSDSWIYLKTKFGTFSIICEDEGLTISGKSRVNITPNAANSFTITQESKFNDKD